MARTSVLEAVDRLIDGGLGQWFDEGLSVPAVRDRIRDEYGITVSFSSVYRWKREHLEAA